MSKAEDVHTLFRRFGGDASTYQEIVASEQAQSATGKWPMLAQIKPTQHHEAPAVMRAVPSMPARQYQALGEAVTPVEPVVPAGVEIASAVRPVISNATAYPAAEKVVSAAHSAPTAVSASAPTESVPIAVDSLEAEGRSSLKAMFNRMLPVVESDTPQPASPLKRLVKW